MIPCEANFCALNTDHVLCIELLRGIHSVTYYYTDIRDRVSVPPELHQNESSSRDAIIFDRTMESIAFSLSQNRNFVFKYDFMDGELAHMKAG